MEPKSANIVVMMMTIMIITFCVTINLAETDKISGVDEKSCVGYCEGFCRDKPDISKCVRTCVADFCIPPKAISSELPKSSNLKLCGRLF
ncbi:hypothetical protein CASFOL_026003 [Castilleja foliolosa]|uniref:Plant thionin family protein n=1 Tax=Castilleja foliolosa TaxID=1961234 RepID=A0ABD3CV98_9LAMI